MGIQTALDNILLKPCKAWAHAEYSLGYHKALVEKKGWDWFGLDFNWHTNDGIIEWGKAGRITDMGHASYAADGSDQREPVVSPFISAEEVWAFDAVAEYGLPDFDEQVRAYEKIIQDARKNTPDRLTTGGYYRSIVSGAIQSFGWDMYLEAAADREKMEKVYDGFFRRTLFHMKAWAKTSVEAVIQHDDFVWTSGMFMHPDIYRKVIIPLYAELWKPIHEAGKKVLFCSDGLFIDLAEDVAKAGADGFIFEPCNDFGLMAERFGKSHCLVGSFVDCRDLTFGKWDKVKADIDRTLDCLKRCKGAIFAVGNHVPPNIPEEMMVRYFEYLLPRLERK